MTLQLLSDGAVGWPGDENTRARAPKDESSTARRSLEANASVWDRKRDRDASRHGHAVRARSGCRVVWHTVPEWHGPRSPSVRALGVARLDRARGRNDGLPNPPFTCGRLGLGCMGRI
jgi:hypothetical protein